jgi:hypothetical protein
MLHLTQVLQVIALLFGCCHYTVTLQSPADARIAAAAAAAAASQCQCCTHLQSASCMNHLMQRRML